MKRVIFIASLICYLGFIDYGVPCVFARGEEYMKGRVAPGVSEEVPISGAPIVEYFLAPDDVMEILVWQNPDLTRDVVIGPDGYISYPLLGRLKVAGLSISQLEEILTERFADYIKSPQVSVMMKKFAGNQIIILGEIETPGIYTYKGSLNLIQAIALAGDFGGGACSDSVLVIRGNLTENPEVKRINMTRVIKRGTTSTDIILQPNDVVYVPRAFIADVNKFLGNLQPILDMATRVLDVGER